ncbi:MAG: hypothetical protein ACR2LT_02810 [Pyrinomonadaceae bacterium]
MAETKKCEHEPCSCTVSGDSDYCSPQCENAGAQGIISIECECGHSGCS